jgi:hypothetical protein
MPGLVILTFIMLAAIAAGLAYVGLSRPAIEQQSARDVQNSTFQFKQEPIVAPSMNTQGATADRAPVELNNPINTSGTVSGGASGDYK